MLNCNARFSLNLFPNPGSGVFTLLIESGRYMGDLSIPWNTGYAKRPGDLIFDSYSIANPEIPPGYNKYIRMSDHLPVIAVLPKN